MVRCQRRKAWIKCCTIYSLMLSVTLLFEILSITSSNCFKTSFSSPFSCQAKARNFVQASEAPLRMSAELSSYQIWNSSGGRLISCNILKRICEVPPSGIWYTGYNLKRQSADCSYVLLIWRTVWCHLQKLRSWSWYLCRLWLHMSW
jgi:hypothetical protein